MGVSGLNYDYGVCGDPGSGDPTKPGSLAMEWAGGGPNPGTRPPRPSPTVTGIPVK